MTTKTSEQQPNHFNKIIRGNPFFHCHIHICLFLCGLMISQPANASSCLWSLLRDASCCSGQESNISTQKVIPLGKKRADNVRARPPSVEVLLEIPTSEKQPVSYIPVKKIYEMNATSPASKSLFLETDYTDGTNYDVILPENTFTLTSTAICQKSRKLDYSDARDFAIIRKLTITDKITNMFFSELTKLPNLEELILNDCENVTSISPLSLRKLRHVELHNIYMDVRVAGYHCEGLHVSYLLNILTLPNLKILTIHAFDLIETDTNTLTKVAVNKDIALYMLSSSRSALRLS